MSRVHSGEACVQWEGLAEGVGSGCRSHYEIQDGISIYEEINYLFKVEVQSD